MIYAPESAAGLAHRLRAGQPRPRPWLRWPHLLWHLQCHKHHPQIHWLLRQHHLLWHLQCHKHHPQIHWLLRQRHLLWHLQCHKHHVHPQIHWLLRRISHLLRLHLRHSRSAAPYATSSGSTAAAPPPLAPAVTRAPRASPNPLAVTPDLPSPEEEGRRRRPWRRRPRPQQRRCWWQPPALVHPLPTPPTCPAGTSA